MTNGKKIASTFGTTPGAKLTLKVGADRVTLVVPEGALDRDYNLDWSVVERNPPKNGQVSGPVARLSVLPGGRTQHKMARTDGAAFEFRLSLGDRETLNLAIGTVVLDARGQETKTVEWQVVTPTGVEPGLTGGKNAHFEVSSIGAIQYVHATTDPASSPPAG
ncbi:MAG: hypothetical protein AAF928_05575 [Myxococcota bacterium]